MYECETCTASFWNQYDCQEHMEDYGHWPECETCDRTFRTQHSCNQHMDDTDHWAPRFGCETCDKEFLSQGSANQHMNALRHWAPKVPCETCKQKFFSQRSADQHMEDLGHYKFYCSPCERRFQNENSLKMHLNSKIHRGRNVPCPSCRVSFTSASGVSHHLETGSCPKAPNLNRESILRMIRQRDPSGIITIKQIEWKDENTGKYSATDRAFNGDSWECYICHRCFPYASSLNSHLNSPVHKQNVYHCPNRRDACGKEFATLAALFNHLESEACSFMRFEKVQKHVGDVLNGRRMIAFR